MMGGGGNLEVPFIGPNLSLYSRIGPAAPGAAGSVRGAGLGFLLRITGFHYTKKQRFFAYNAGYTHKGPPLVTPDQRRPRHPAQGGASGADWEKERTGEPGPPGATRPAQAVCVRGPVGPQRSPCVGCLGPGRLASPPRAAVVARRLYPARDSPHTGRPHRPPVSAPSPAVRVPAAPDGPGRCRVQISQQAEPVKGDTTPWTGPACCDDA